MIYLFCIEVNEDTSPLQSRVVGSFSSSMSWICLSPGYTWIFLVPSSKQVVERGARKTIQSSVSNGCGPLLWVRVRVRFELATNWRSRSSINPNRRFRYVSIEISLPIWIRRDLSRLSSGSICKYVQFSCHCCLIIVLNQNGIFNIQDSDCACFAGYDVDNIWIHVFPSIICIFDGGGGR